MKFSFTLFAAAVALPLASGFATPASASPRSVSSSLSATVSGSKLVPPKKVQNLPAEELYDQNVQQTYGRYKLTIKSGHGCYLQTTDGKEYLDCVSGIATCALGHANEKLTQAISKQMGQVHHVSNLYFIPEQAALANWLCENSGADKAFFCNSGAEANEAAIKVARRHASNRGITVRFSLSFVVDLWFQNCYVDG